MINSVLETLTLTSQRDNPGGINQGNPIVTFDAGGIQVCPVWLYWEQDSGKRAWLPPDFIPCAFCLCKLCYVSLPYNKS